MSLLFRVEGGLEFTVYVYQYSLFAMNTLCLYGLTPAQYNLWLPSWPAHRFLHLVDRPIAVYLRLPYGTSDLGI